MRKTLSRQVIFSDGGKYFDCHGISDNRCPVIHISGYHPAVTGPDLMHIIADSKHHMTRNQVPGLFLRVLMGGKNSIFLQHEFRHESMLTMDQGFPGNPFRYR